MVAAASDPNQNIQTMSYFVIACGGTGGHLSPGISLAENLMARGHDCLLIVSEKAIDGRLLEKYPHLRFRRAPGAGLSRTPHGFIRFVFSQIKAIVFALKLVAEKRPVAFVSFGGFLTAGMALVCRARSIPVIFHEANRVPGKAIRLLAGIAARVWLPPGVSIPKLSPAVQRHVGMPVRKEIVRLPKLAARRELGLPENDKLLLIVGGSQGATALNEWVKGNFKKIASLGVNIFCITGPGKSSGETLEFQHADGRVRTAQFIPFCAQMAEILSAADLVVSRAGAGSIAEFTACELPAILVPYPFSADNHQDENARFFEQQGGGFVVMQDDLDKLADEVCDTIGNEWLLEKFRENLRRIHEEFNWQIMADDLEKGAKR